MLGKSVKPIPVMILGVVLARKYYPLAKYFYVLMITLGVALFMYKPSDNKLTEAEPDSLVGFGELLLVISGIFHCWLFFASCLCSGLNLNID